MSSINSSASRDLLLDLQSGKSLKDELQDKYDLNGRLNVPRSIENLGNLLSSGACLKLDKGQHVQVLRGAGGTSSLNENSSIELYFKLVGNIPKVERANFRKQTLPLIQSLNELHAISILTEVAAIDFSEREAFCRQVAPLIASISCASEKYHVLCALARTAKDERADLIAQVKPLLKDLDTSGKDVGTLFEVAGKLLKEERATLVAQVELLVVGIRLGWHREEVLDTLKGLPVAERAAFVEQVLPLASIRDERQRVRYLQMLGQLALPAPTLAPVQQEAPLVDPYAVAQGENPLLKVLATVPPEDRVDVIIQTESILAKCQGVFTADSAVFLAVAQFPYEQRREVCQFVAAQNLAMQLELIAALLQSIQAIPLDDRTPTALAALVALVKLKYANHNYIAVPEALNQLALEQRGPFVIHALAHYRAADSIFLRERILIIYWKSQRGEAFHTAYTSLIAAKDMQWTTDERLSLALVLALTPATEWPRAIAIMKEQSICRSFLALKTLALQPQDIRTVAIFETYLTNLRCLKKGRHDFVFTKLLTFIPPQLLEEAIELLDTTEFKAMNVDLSTLNTAMSLLLARESFKEAIYSYLQKQLMAEISAAEKWELVQLIMESQNLLQLHDEHYLLQQAVLEGTLCAPDARNDPKNPYRIYGDLRATLAQEALFDIAPEGSVIADEMIMWDVAQLRALNISKSRTFADLPTGLTFATLQQRFTRLEMRLQALPEDERAQVHLYIEQSMGDEENTASLKKLKGELLDKPFIPSLFIKHAKPDDPISASTFQLYTILQALGEADDTLAPGQVLTEREEMLLRLGASVQACDRGQKEGLAKFYNTLPQAVSLGVAAIDEGAESIMWHVVDTGVQETLKHVLDNPALLELGDTNVMVQGVHNSTYLKNRYHLQLGFKHKLEFDTHTNVLDNKLLAIAAEAPKEAVEIIFRSATPEKAHRQVMLVANRIFVQENLAKAEAKQKGAAFTGRSLYSAIDELAQQAKKDISYFISFKYDEADEYEENPIEQLTPAGALFLIKKRGTMRSVGKNKDSYLQY